MTKFTLICLAICLFSGFAFSQSRPFEVFDNAVETESTDSKCDKENLFVIFNQERRRLGENFETELWKYLGKDVENYYWIACFLDREQYLRDNGYLPGLLFKIRQRGIKLIANSNDEEKLGRKITFLRDLAIASYLSGKSDLAIEYKKQATTIYKKYKDIGGWVGATTELNNCIYDNLEKDPDICKEDESQPKEKIIIAGILNGKSTVLPKPVYPKTLKKKRISGQVTVKVIIDFDGLVIFAEAIKGIAELFEVSVEAAKKAKFSPTLLSGKPVKVSGVIVYDFVK